MSEYVEDLTWKDESKIYGSGPFDSLPVEAMNIGGRFLEDIIPGYRTLNVQGRELYETENHYVQLGIRDGESHVYNRLQARVLTIEYYLVADTPEAFRDAFNRLNVALFNEKEQMIWFNDEPEMYFIGNKGTVDEVEPGKNWTISKFTIQCGDPYKYSKSDATSVTWGSTMITFQANYLMGNTGSGAVDLPIIIEGGAYWGSTMITFQNQSYFMGDDGTEVKPIEIYPTVDGLKVKPIITLKGTGRAVWVKTRNDTIDLGDFDNAEIVIDTKTFTITQNGKLAIRPMNDFYIYPGEPLYIQAKDSDFRITIEYPNRYL